MKELKDKRVFLFGGPGGVGKTTLAAAVGAKLAEQGHRTVVLTVDPARRLAQALGLKDFSTELQRIDLGNGKELYATMLDTQRYFDRVIAKFALSDGQRDRILNHRLYRIMVESLGGTHEYAAMERLLEFVKETDFEKIIVDTPPSQNAVDLLRAPERLSDFMDNSVLKWFQKRSAPLSLFKQGTKMAMKVLEKIFGADFLSSLSEVLSELDGMQSGFHQRNREVIELLQGNATAFFIVTYPSEVRYQESLDFIDALKDMKIPRSAVLINRVEPEVPSELRQQASEVVRYYETLHEEQMRWVKSFQDLELPVHVIERAEDLSSLSKLITFL